MLSDSELLKLKEILKEQFSDYSELAGGKNYRYYHLISTHNYVQKLMESEEIKELDFDPRVVEVSALFHDIGRSEDIEDGRMNPFDGHEGHPLRGSKIVGDFVDDFVTEEQLEKIEKVIENHHSEAETVEGKIVQDADELFKYGVQGYWRMFHYAAEKERTIEDTISYFNSTESNRLEKLLEDFYFNKTREVAKKRLEKQIEGMNRIDDELKGEDF